MKRFQAGKNAFVTRTVMAVFLLAFVIAAQPVLAQVSYEVNLTNNDLTFTVLKGYNLVSLKGGSFLSGIGKPQLPVKYVRLICPSNTVVDSLLMPVVVNQTLSGTYRIFPAQPPFSETPLPWVDPDTSIYNSNRAYPGKIAEVVHQGYFDGNRIVTVAVYPLRWVPRSGQLSLTTRLQFTLSLRSVNNSPAVKATIRGEKGQEAYRSALPAMVDNPNDIPRYKVEPTVVPENALPSGPGQPGFFTYVIITDGTLTNAFVPLRDWLLQEGINAGIATTGQIYYYYSGVDNAEKVRNYIIAAYQHGCTYVLLGGGVHYPHHTAGQWQEWVPIRYCNPYGDDPDPCDGFHIPADIYYSDLTGDWDADHDNYWGEWLDDTRSMYPNVFVGRIPCVNAATATKWVNKRLLYEKNPGNGDLSYLTKAVTWLQWANGFPYEAQQANNLIPSYYLKTTWCGDLNGQYSWDAISYWSSTKPGLTLDFSHGSPWDFAVKTKGPTDPESPFCIYSADWINVSGDQNGIDNLTTANYPLIGYSKSCMNGAYEMRDDWYPPNAYGFPDTSIVEGYLTTYSTTCAAAWFGYTRYGICWGDFGQPDWLANAFLSLLFPSMPPYVAPRAGILEGLSKPAIPWQSDTRKYENCLGHNLFGDPEMVIYNNTPSQLVAAPNPQTILVNQQTNVTVTVTLSGSGIPVSGAYVCLYKVGDVNLTGTTNAYGQVTFSVTAHSAGTINVTATANYNYIPGVNTIQVWSGPGGGQSAGLVSRGLPTTYSLSPLSPSPFQDNTEVKYQLPEQGVVNLEVYDVEGRLVRTLAQGQVTPGYYFLRWDGKDNASRVLPGGVYFVKFKVNEYESIQKAILLR